MASKLPVPVEQPNENDATLRQILQDVLGLSEERVAELDAESGLFGYLPELDSMAVAGLLTEVSQLSGNLLKREPERAAALVNRWTGDAGRFTQV